MSKVAILGTGLLGAGFADGFLSRGGTDLTVWNRTRARAEPFAAKGVRVAATAAEAVKGVDLVHLVLFDDATVDETIAALRPGLDARTVIIDHTTTLPAQTAERSRRLTKEGVSYLHAPVMMGPPAARTATGMMLVSGSTALFDRVKNDLKPMTGDLWYLGERADLAAAFKLFGNAMGLIIGGGLGDIFHLADALHVSRADALGLFSRFKVDGAIAVRGKKIVDEDYEATFTMETARKDARLMLESGAGQPMPLLHAVAARMDDLIAKGHGHLDWAAVAKKGA